MIEVIQSLQANALLFGLLVLRISGMMVTAPVLNSRAIPVKARAGMAAILALAVLPLLADGTLTMPQSVVAYVVLAAKELAMGLFIGLIAQTVFAGVQVAASSIDTGAGFAIAQTIDPTSNVNLALLGRVYALIATTVFVAIGGHLWLVRAVVASFQMVPPTRVPNIYVLADGMVARTADIFVIALQIAAPLMAALLITDVALGIMSRAAPQMNVFIVGLPVKVGVALVGTAILLPAFVTLLNGLTEQMLQDLSNILQAAGR